jgi:TRAP-type C4-dicarboxylate transport system permease small subunit
MTFLGSAWVLCRRKHVAVDVITGRLGFAGRRMADVLHSIVGVGLCGVLFWYSFRMTLNFFQRGVTDVQAVDMPKYVILMVIPIGFLLITAQFFRNLVVSLLRAEPDQQKVNAKKGDSESGERGMMAERRKVSSSSGYS